MDLKPQPEWPQRDSSCRPRLWWGGLGQASTLPTWWCFLSTPDLPTHRHLLSSPPQFITARHQASAPNSAATPPSCPPRSRNCPNPGPSASSPSTSPSPRPSARKAKATWAVSLCDCSCLLPPAFRLLNCQALPGQPWSGLLPHSPQSNWGPRGSSLLGRYIPFLIPQKTLPKPEPPREACSSCPCHISVSVYSLAMKLAICAARVAFASMGSAACGLPQGLCQQPCRRQQLPHG